MNAPDLLTPLVDKTKYNLPPRPRGRACVVVLAGSHLGEWYPVDQDLCVGRGSEADVTILDEGLSRRHFRLTPLQTGEVVLDDLQSTNGTFVNGLRVTQRYLVPGDKILVGQTTVLKFAVHDELDESFQRRMYDSALRDALTGAFNKRYFEERMAAEYAFASRHGTPLTLCILDLDHFKRVNDRYGHMVGDLVLQRVCDRIGRAVRTEDVFTRYGGEEFAVISAGIPLDNGLVLAERLRTHVARAPIDLGDFTIDVTTSIGVSGFPNDGVESVEAMVGAADQALYRAKHAGRNRVAVIGL